VTLRTAGRPGIVRPGWYRQARRAAAPGWYRQAALAAAPGWYRPAGLAVGRGRAGV